MTELELIVTEERNAYKISDVLRERNKDSGRGYYIFVSSRDGSDPAEVPGVYEIEDGHIHFPYSCESTTREGMIEEARRDFKESFKSALGRKPRFVVVNKSYLSEVQDAMQTGYDSNPSPEPARLGLGALLAILGKITGPADTSGRVDMWE